MTSPSAHGVGAAVGAGVGAGVGASVGAGVGAGVGGAFSQELGLPDPPEHTILTPMDFPVPHHLFL